MYKVFEIHIQRLLVTSMVYSHDHGLPNGKCIITLRRDFLAFHTHKIIRKHKLTQKYNAVNLFVPGYMFIGPRMFTIESGHVHFLLK